MNSSNYTGGMWQVHLGVFRCDETENIRIFRRLSLVELKDKCLECQVKLIKAH